MVASSRLWLLDIFRGLALIAMIIFHFTFDLSYFGFIRPDTVYRPNWILFQQLIAGSFIFAAGFSLELAHGTGVQWASLKKRFLVLGGAAGAVSLITYMIFAAFWVRFGILHCILACSVLGLVCVSWKTKYIAAITATLMTLAVTLESPVAISASWDFLINTTNVHQSVDYRPIFPWVAVFFIGLLTSRLFSRLLILPVPELGRLASTVVSGLQLMGRNSLLVYLVHQPLLFAGLIAYVYLT